MITPFGTETENRDFVDGRKEYRCMYSKLPVLELEEFVNIPAGDNYYFNIRKIGSNIVHFQNNGDSSTTDMRFYYEKLEEFIKAASVELPYIEIRDMRHVSGNPSPEAMRFQRDYLQKNDSCKAFIVCNTSLWLRATIRAAMKIYYNLPMAVRTGSNLKSAVETAIDLNRNSKSNSFPELSGESISFDDIEFRTNWEYQNSETGTNYINGAVYAKLWYSKIKGSYGAEDMPKIKEVCERMFRESGLTNTSYYRVVDYAEVHKSKFTGRREYAKMLNELNSKFNSSPAVTYIVGANRAVKAGLNVFGTFVKQRFVFLNTIDEAFKQIKNAEVPDKQIKVTKADIEEVNVACGSLLWDTGVEALGWTPRTDKNPLIEIVENLEIVREDLDQLRQRDRRNIKNLETILNAIRAGVVVIEKKSNYIVHCNAFFEELTGRKLSELVDVPIRVLFENSIEAKKQEETDEITTLTKSNGEKMPVMRFDREISFKGQEALLVTFVDISKQQKADIQLKETLHETEKMNKFMEGREDRIIELKEEINELREKLGMSPKYGELS
jgi:PAS domain-containing protein